jgi:hypothetical protein
LAGATSRAFRKRRRVAALQKSRLENCRAEILAGGIFAIAALRFIVILEGGSDSEPSLFT